MALIGIHAWQGRVGEIGGDTAIVPWTIMMPEGAVKGVAQVSLATYHEEDDQATASCAIVGIYHHGVFNSAGYDEVGEPGARLVTYDDGLTGVTMHLLVNNCIARFLLEVFVFE